MDYISILPLSEHHQRDALTHCENTMENIIYLYSDKGDYVGLKKFSAVVASGLGVAIFICLVNKG